MHKDALPIAEPCHADWNAMKRGDTSRFCGDCKKSVHDLSKLSASRAAALFAAPATEGLCVRYLYDELGHVVFADTFRDRPVPVVALLRKTAKAAAAAALLALPLSLTACMGAMQRPMPVAPPPAAPATDAAAVDPNVLETLDKSNTSDAGVTLAK